jgi:hypothetical protein
MNEEGLGITKGKLVKKKLSKTIFIVGSTRMAIASA